MNKHGLQFSLCILLMFIAMLAIVIAFAAHQPRIASLILLFASPFLIGRAMPFVCLVAPRQARWIMGFSVPAYSSACALLVLRSYPPNEFDGRKWLSLGA